MPKTLEEYHRYWQEHDFPDAERITPTSCVLSGSYLATAPGMSDAFFAFDDFGDAVGFCRYHALDEEVENYRRAKHRSQEDVAAYRKEAAGYFDELLERFVRDGYQPEMSSNLREGIEQYFHIYQLDTIFVLPDDVEDLLDYSGNPFKSRWDNDEEEDEEDQRYKMKFDLDNPDHRDKLYTRLYEMIL